MSSRFIGIDVVRIFPIALNNSGCIGIVHTRSRIFVSLVAVDGQSDVEEGKGRIDERVSD